MQRQYSEDYPLPGITETSAARPGSRRFHVAVVIPLEYHRGMALECIRGWACAQDFPGERYQILVAAAASHDQEELETLRALIRPWDEIAVFDHAHDMSLVEAIAKRADADLLLFSESHCVPQVDALSYLVGVAERHPDWAGLSAPTHGLTHNLLSKIECDIYSGDIRGKLSSHDWLRVLDQCFLIRREPYDSVGGFRGQFGHFAEWLFAASMKIQGLQLGVADRAVVHHGYIGDYEDLETFTTDFAYGQIKYLNEHAHEPAASLFPTIPELEEQLRHLPASRLQVARFVLRDLWRVLSTTLHKLRNGEGAGPLAAHFLWVYRSTRLAEGNAEIKQLYAAADARRARKNLEKAVRKGDTALAHDCFVEWFARLEKKGRFAYLWDLERSGLQQATNRTVNFPKSGSWTADAHHSLAELFNVHDAEGTGFGSIRWTLPAFQILLPLHAGRKRIVMEWVKARPLQNQELISIRFDGRRLDAGEWTLEPTRLVLNFVVDQAGWHEVFVSVYPFQGRGDGRLFGLPLKVVHWLSVDPMQSASDANSRTEPPRYFLHVPKCGGTTIATLVSNRFASANQYSPYLSSYYPADLKARPPSGLPADCYVGHFGWHLPELMADKPLRISTVLRHPIDRLISRFHYDRQLGRIHQGLDFTTWLRTSVRFDQTMISHFVTDITCGCEVGGEAIRQVSGVFQETAISHLRSCSVVGLTERMDDTINLLAMEMGFFPPLTLPRNNPTDARPRLDSLEPGLLREIEHWFAADFTLYDEARSLFEWQRDKLYDALLASSDGQCRTAEVRNILRERYLDKLRQESTRHTLNYKWTADDIFHGDNLHQREHDGTQCLRWTGESDTTPFYLALASNLTWDLLIRLHPATPAGHVYAARLELRGREVPLRVEEGPGNYRLHAHLEPDDALEPSDSILELRLIAPTVRGEGEFRQLGLALTGMTATCTDD